MHGPANRKQWLLLIGALALAIVAVGLGYLHYDSPLSREWVVRQLEKRYKVQVQLATFHSSLFPWAEVSGTGLVLRRPGDASLPPMVAITSFHADARWGRMIFGARHVGHVVLTGLVLNIPPKNARQGKASKQAKSALVLSSIDANNAVLNILSSKPGKPPRVIAIQNLHMQARSGNDGMDFEAELTNPKPIGQILSTGHFGPWDADDPASTPLDGKYQFSHADLSTIHGLAGILASQGTFSGPLADLTVKGTTTTPDFALGADGNAISLRTQFTAFVDGTSGDTDLQPVVAYLGKSKITARGSVIRGEGKKGKIIHLAVQAGGPAGPAHLEDLLGLAVKSDKPPMLGAITTQATLDIQPGEADVVQRMRLGGRFKIDNAYFTDPDVQAKMVTLNRRGQGEHGPAPAPGTTPRTTFTMQGQFLMANGNVNLPQFVFAVPGAVVSLSGTYAIASQVINFHGTVAMPAKLSEMTTGLKSLLLKALDPLLEHGTGGTVLPIKITGQRSHPIFKVEIGKALRGEK